MIDPQLIGYIKDCLARNIPMDQIRKSLTEQGWSEFDVNGAINLATQQAPMMTAPAGSILPQQAKPAAGINLPKNIIFIAGGAFVFLIILIVVILLLTGSSGLSENKLLQGASVSLGEGKESEFTLNKEDHKIIVDSVKTDSVDITIQSSPITATLAVGETKKFDLDGNQTYDISVKLSSITDNKADLFIRKINEKICTEEWECGEWSDCADDSQTRTCEDKNDCKTEKDKPEETQECESAESGNETELNETNLSAAMNCTEPNGTDINCFIDSVAACKVSELTYDFTMNLVGWVQTNSYYYKITGLAGGKCELYERVIDTSGVYSEAKRTSLAGEGNTPAEIDEMEATKNDELSNYLNKSGTCRYTKSQLTSMLTELRDTGVLLPVDNFDAYECTGPLYEVNLTVTDTTDDENSTDENLTICSSDFLDLCDETNCTSAGGYWYSDTCNEENLTE